MEYDAGPGAELLPALLAHTHQFLADPALAGAGWHQHDVRINAALGRQLLSLLLPCGETELVELN